METTQTERAEHALPNNPFVPPKGDVCYVNELPPELLSRIFELGSADGDSEEDMIAYFAASGGGEEEDMVVDDLHHNLETNDKQGGDAETKAKGDETNEDGDSDATGSTDPPTFTYSFQVSVSHVCRRWRRVTLSTPSIWTVISVAPVARPPYGLESMYLERSQSLPIDISVACQPQDDDDDVEPPSDADLKFLFSLLTSHIHRWRTVEVSSPEYHHIYVFLSAVSDPSIITAPQLTSLKIRYDEKTDEWPTSFGYPSMSKYFTLFGGSAPLLSSLFLWGVHVNWDQPLISSASNLTDLELAFHTEDVFPSWSQFSSILRSAPALEKLTLHQSGPSGDPREWFIEPTSESPADLNAPIQLRRLMQIALSFYPQARAIGLFRRLCLPALKNLALAFHAEDFTDFVHELAVPATLFSAEEQPCNLLNGLERLQISRLPCRPECAQMLYGELRNLRFLGISMLFLPSQFLVILGTPCTLPGRGDVWLPRLEVLNVSGASIKVLREIVQMRKDAGTPLTSLYAEESVEVESEDVEWLIENLERFTFSEGSEEDDRVIIVQGSDEDDDDEWTDTDTE